MALSHPWFAHSALFRARSRGTLEGLECADLLGGVMCWLATSPRHRAHSECLLGAAYCLLIPSSQSTSIISCLVPSLAIFPSSNDYDACLSKLIDA